MEWSCWFTGVAICTPYEPCEDMLDKSCITSEETIIRTNSRTLYLVLGVGLLMLSNL